MGVRLGRRRAAVVAVFFLVGAVVAGCGGAGSGGGEALRGESVVALLRPKFVLPVRDGQVGVSPGEPLAVRVDDGRLTGVTLLTPEGDPVQGRIAPDGRSWRLGEQLGFGRTYRLRADAVGLAGVASAELSFTTLAPLERTHPWMVPGDGEVVGIGQPVAVQFDENIADRRAVQDAIRITTVPPVEGAFYWVTNREVRWRPENFWAPGTRITVDVNTYGRDLGRGLIGDNDIHASFTVGDATIFTADDNTKTVTVERNGQVLRSMPTSMGKDSTPTDNGVYILSDRFDRIIMDSTTFGVPSSSSGGYRTPVDWATRMSYSGIFMHSAPWSVGQQGSVDTSHGCLNLSPADARWVYDNAKRGDIAIVKNTVGGTLSGLDGLGDWNIPWPEWKAGNADTNR
ncbi:L,D-transpeptidase family protein [Nocardia terpenica]|uniref:L,D-transpeptidase n=1 Tax=Nocardia terpenica TaxID=455432 RepID=UPI0018963A98|nr:Ig-like domain-containing protein [Nocardia terpenica]MBF6064724.1 L,D-transpeptidase family protein [Nocardia terpenica]MBF6107239.1 L,D-transpeptidase family protein [Nocardia terpenica]MBF6114996.1 L,D-transpeptidase family protein [Nocardia terpenica]MBF6122102.1 L,D-transpeptidase family protein [Nocardia terpenica]MBF6154485.1 L,D-transpeptidase family protein [Nocardia terpenica]